MSETPKKDAQDYLDKAVELLSATRVEINEFLTADMMLKIARTAAVISCAMSLRELVEREPYKLTHTNMHLDLSRVSDAELRKQIMECIRFEEHK